MKIIITIIYFLLIVLNIYGEVVAITKEASPFFHIMFVCSVLWSAITIYGIYISANFLKYMLLISAAFQIIFVLLGFSALFDTEGKYYFHCGKFDCTYQASFLILIWAAFKVIYANKN